MINPNKQTNAFADKFFSFDFFPLIDKPTCTSTEATLIDNIWTNNLKYVTKNAIVVDPIANYFALYKALPLQIAMYKNYYCTLLRYFNNKNVKKFLNQLQNISWEEFYVDSDPDHVFNKLLDKIQSRFYESFSLCNAGKEKV